MAFFDKLSGMAKNIGDKASDSIEITKLNNKIKAEKAAISAACQKLGEFYYAQHAVGEDFAPGAAEFLADIDARNEAIGQLQAEIERIQAEAAAAKAAAAAAQAAAAAAAAAPYQAAAPVVVAAPAEAPAEVPAAARVCACGAVVPEGMSFCGSCGARFA